MPSIAARDLLDRWEAARGEPWPLRTAALAALAAGVEARDALGWSLARHDAALCALRRQLFGETLDAVTRCPACGEPLELGLHLSQLEASSPDGDNERTIALRGGAVRYRPPTAADLLAISALPDAAAARAALLARCMPDAADVEREAAALVLEAERPDARFALTCPACAHAWTEQVDLGRFLWREVEAWAERTLGEIHLIAGAYGWPEEEILRLSARRRRTYVEMIA